MKSIGLDTHWYIEFHSWAEPIDNIKHTARFNLRLELTQEQLRNLKNEHETRSILWKIFHLIFVSFH